MEPAKTPSPSETKLHFLDYWRIIRIRKTVILAVFLLVVITTTAVTFILPESFSSTVRIAVEKDTSDIPGLFERQNVASYDPYFMETEFQKIQSKKVLYQVITNLNLTKIWADRLKIDNLKLSEAFMLLKRNMDVRQARNTSLIEIRVFSEDKEEAAKIANKIADVYKATRLEQRIDMSREGIKKLKTEYDNQYVKVKGLQDDLANKRAELKISDYIAEGGGPISTLEPETLRSLEKDRIAAEGDLNYAQTRLTELTSLSRPDLRKSILTVVQDQPLTTLMQTHDETRQRFTVVKSEYGEEHPEVKKLAALTATIDQQINDRLDGIIGGMKATVAAFKNRAESVATEVKHAKERDLFAATNNRPYFLIKGELETEKQILQTMKFKLIQEEVDMNLPKTSIVDITDPAEPGLRPDRPRIALNIALGVIVGLIVGVGLAFFIEYLDTSVKTIDDVERALGAPVLGVIPQNVGSLLEEGPESPHAEAYRVLRTNVLFSRKDLSLNSLTVISGGAGEGKSTTIFNLATVFAQNGHRVLLVDSDLRRPSIHKILNVSNSIGLTNLLLRQNTIEQVVQTTNQAGLDFLPSGKLPSSSMGILNSTQMKEFVSEAKRRYDFVFFDSPPIMGVSDASILASLVDMSLLVIQYRKYPQAMTVRAKQMVEKVGGMMLGVVLNNINISQDSYYYYYSGYYYDYYSKQDDEGSSAKSNGEKKKAPGDRASIDLKQKY